MLWTLIISFVVGGTPQSYGHEYHWHAIPSANSIVVNNLPSKEACQAAGKAHIAKLNATDNHYTYFVGVYTCVETK